MLAFEQSYWAKLFSDANVELPLAEVDDLARAAQFRAELRAQILSADRVFYVAYDPRMRQMRHQAGRSYSIQCESILRGCRRVKADDRSSVLIASELGLVSVSLRGI